VQLSAICVLLATAVLSPLSAGAVDRAQRDDFAAIFLGLDNWNPSLTTTTPGPDGASDFYLLVTSDGTGMKGRMICHNQSQWSGDYLAAGVQAIGFEANNLGATSLNLRLALGTTDAPSQGGTWFVTNTAQPLPPGSGWQFVVLSTRCADLIAVQGTDTCAQVLSSVSTLRIVSAAAPSAMGDLMIGSLGLDRIQAIPSIPVFPALEEGH
jgi:hypothetical protein